MKKRIIIPTMLSAVLALSSCVKDNESDSVKDLRGAHAEQLRAKATYDLSSAKVQDAMAKVEEAKAKEAEAMIALNVKAKELANAEQELKNAAEAVRNAALARDEAEKAAGSEDRIKAAIIQQQDTLLKQQRALAVYQAKLAALEKAEVAAKEAEAEAQEKLATALKTLREQEMSILKEQGQLVQDKVNEYNSILEQLNQAKLDLVQNARDIIAKERTIELNKKQLLSTEATNAVELSTSRVSLAQQKALVEALEKVVADAGTLDTQIGQAESKLQETNLAYNKEYQTNKLEDLRAEAISLRTVVTSTDKTDMRKFIKDFTQKLNSAKGYEYVLDGSLLRVSLEDCQVGTFDESAIVSEDGLYTYGLYPYSYKLLYFDYSSYEYKDIDAAYIAKVDKFISLIGNSASGYNKLIAEKKGSSSDTEASVTIVGVTKKRDKAKQNWEAEMKKTGVAYSQVLVDQYAKEYADAVELLGQLQKELADYEERLAGISSDVADFERFRAIIADATSEDRVAFDPAIKAYNDAVQKAADQYFKEQALYKAYQDAYKLHLELQGVRNGYTTVQGVLNNAKKRVAELEVTIQQSLYATTQEAILAKAEQDLVKLKSDTAAIEARIAALEAKLAVFKP